MPLKTVLFVELIREINQQMHQLGKEKIKAKNQKPRPIIKNILKRKEQN